jgi:hypothetical protein
MGEMVLDRPFAFVVRCPRSFAGFFLYWENTNGSDVSFRYRIIPSTLASLPTAWVGGMPPLTSMCETCYYVSA